MTTTHGLFAALSRRYGRVFTVNLSLFGQAVVISDPVLIKDVFTASIDLIERPTGAGHLGEAFGPGSTFSLGGDELLARRKLVVPPFQGKRVRSYEHIVEDEVMREIANWPQGREFKTLQPMMRMTLNVILRAVFGAQGPALDELRGLLPPLVTMVGAIAVLSPKLRTDLGPWSPGGGFCGTGAGSTLWLTRSSPMRGPTRPSKSAATCSRCWSRPGTTTVSRSRISTSPTSC